MTAKIHQPACELTEGCWVDFREMVQQVEPELFDIIEKINPNKEHKLIKARYLYGEQITDLGTICVPDKFGRLVRLDNANVSSELQDQLGYCPTPLVLQLKNAGEVFVETEDRIAPLNIFMPGDMYGLYEILVPLSGCPAVPCWSITSGGRSVFLASKITDAIGHKKLRKEFGVSPVPPKNIKDQWATMKTIANRGRKDNPWSSEILIFTKEWFTEKDDDINWMRFQNYLMKKAWWQSRSTRAQIEYSIMWESFAKAVCARNLKPSSYIVDTVKHLMLLTAGTTPGFKAIDTSENIMPSKIVEKAYTDIYGLKDYAAIIMHPHVTKLNSHDEQVYYSMAYPTLISGTPSIRKNTNTMTEIRDVQTLMKMLEKILSSYEDRVHNSMKNVKFEYFHSDEDRFGEILNSHSITKTDAAILNILNERFPGKKFPSYGSFFRGCIRISRKNVG
ncbi:MAG: hypothetical protein PVI75_01845 [Gammaproteobacteria bacterium]|jgi:hypothetical protein